MKTSNVRAGDGGPTFAPGSLENKFFIMNRAPLDRRMKRKHLAVLGFILDWYHSKYGDALASVRHIVAELKKRDVDGVGLYAGDVHAALSDLVSWGYLSLEPGTGRRASRYTPVWSARSVRGFMNANDGDRSVRVSPNASVLISPNTTGVCVRDSTNEDPSTPTRVTDPGTEKMEFHDCPAPTAPAPGPLGAAEGAGAGQEEGEAAHDAFESLWRAYGRRQRRQDARQAYDKLDPDADVQKVMLDAAEAWQKHWARQNDPDAPRKSLGSWIRSEGYLEDPPAGYRRKEKAPAKTRADRPKKVVDNNQKEDELAPVPSFMWGSPALWPVGRHLVEITNSDVTDDAGDKLVEFHFQMLGGDDTGTEIVHRFAIKSVVRSAEAEGIRYMRDLARACGEYAIEDTDELHSYIIAATADGTKIKYEPATEAEIAEWA